MDSLYITLFFNIFAGIVQTFIKSWTQPASVSPRHRSLPPALWTTSWLLLAPHHRRRTFSQRDVSLGEETSGIHNVTINSKTFFCEFPLDVHLLRWEIAWRNAPRIWRDFGSAMPFQTRLTQTKPVLPLSNEHGSQVNDEGQLQFCHNKHNKFSHRPTRDVSLLSGHASYLHVKVADCNAHWQLRTWVQLT